MGADSSTLQSIEALNSTLEGIEKKLFIIEDIHLHHERVISQDNSVLISGKSIHGRAGTRLLCGPILGTIGAIFARILIEVDNDVELTWNVFQVDNHLITSRYCFSVSSFVRKNVPTCIKIDNLLPDTNYHVYIGGIRPKDIACNYAYFKTLSENNSDFRFILTYNGRVDKQVPGEVDLWNEVGDRILLEKVDILNNLTTVTDDNQSLLPQHYHVNFLCHHGNLISIESILQSRSIQLLDLLSREDSNISEWEQILHDIEVLIKDSYRSALTSPILASVLRRCGGIFLAGTDEAAALTTSLLAAQLPDDIFTSMETLVNIANNNSSLSIDSNMKLTTLPMDDNIASIIASPNLPITSSMASFDSGDNSNSSSKYLSREARRLKEEKEKEENEPFEVKISRLNRSAIAASIDDRDTVDDSVTTAVIGGALRRFQAAEKLSKLTRSTVQEHLRKLLVGMIIRLARRVYWSYFRQLWDDNYSTLIAHDLELEVQFREILKLQKSLQAKSYMFSSLEKSRAKLLKEFGVDNKSLKHFDTRIESLKKDIIEVESCLRTAAIRCGEVEETMEGQSQCQNGVCIKLGSICLLLLESNWGWLGADQQLFYPPIKEVEIHEQIQTDLEKHLNTNVQAVVCLSSCPLLPFTTNLITNQSTNSTTAEPFNEKGIGSLRSNLSNEDSLKMFQFSSMDVRRILTVLAKWQQEQPDRAVLLSGPVSSYRSPMSLKSSLVDSAIGYAIPYATDSSGKEITSDAEFEKPENVMYDIWNRDRSKLQQILVGDMRRQTSPSMSITQDVALLRSMCNSKDSILNQDLTIDVNTQFKSYYDSYNRCIRPCFWDVSFTQQQDLPVCFQANCINDRRSTVNLAVGPVVGSVTYHSAVVMIQICETCQLELICVDQLTGAEFICSRFAVAGQPCFFLFEYLQPNHAYDVLLSPTSHIALRSERQNSMWCSFTTTRFVNYPKYEIDDNMISNVTNVGTDDATLYALRMATIDGNELDVESLAQSSSNILNNDSSHIQGSTASANIPVRPSVLSKSMREDSVIESSMEGNRSSSISYHVNDPLRILLLGSDKPSWRGILSNSSSMDRAYISNGITLANEISNVLCQAWNGIDLVIHCGCSVDWASCIDPCLSILTKAETLRGRLYGSTSSLDFSPDDSFLTSSTYATSGLDFVSSIESLPGRSDVHYHHTALDINLELQLLQQAKDQLCNACVYHWGSTPHTRNLLAHGSHYFLNSPLIDLLKLFHASSLSDLKRDLSSYCVHYLMKLLAEIQSEYQKKLSFYSDNSKLNENNVTDISINNNLKFFDGGTVAMFELKPNFAFDYNDSLQGINDKFIPENQFKALEQLLFPNGSIVKNLNGKSALHTLLILSPLPVIIDDHVYVEYSNLNQQQLGIRYPLEEALSLLDLLAYWLKESIDIEREVIIIAGGVPMSFTTSILIEKNGNNNSLSTDNVDVDKKVMKIKQISCGSLIGVYEGNHITTSNTSTNNNTANNAMSHISLQQSLTDGGILYSEYYRYKYNHHISNSILSGTQCGFLELETKSSIYANNQKQTNNNLVKYKNSVNMSFLNQIELKSMFESNWKKTSIVSLFSDDQKNITEKKLNQSKDVIDTKLFNNNNNNNIVFDKSYYQRSRLQENSSFKIILEKLKSHLHQKDLKIANLTAMMGINTTTIPSSSSTIIEQQDLVVDTIVQAIDNICKSNKNIFLDCHILYIQHNHFDTPVSNGIVVEHSILSILQWIIQRLPLQARAICKVPSSFIIRLVWEYYIHKMKLSLSFRSTATTSTKVVAAATSIIGIHQSTPEVYSSSNQAMADQAHIISNIAASLEADVEYFTSLLQCCIEMQLVLEYKAFNQGLLD